MNPLACHPKGCASCGLAPRGPGLRVALVGNPNVGKSSLFHRLTGVGVHVANYPGTTVTIQACETRYKDQRIQVWDLPGCYSLDPLGEDQRVARRALLDARPDVVVAVLDATNLGRNLYLVLQVLELGLPVVVALNFMDEVARRGLAVRAHELTERLGVPVVPTVARLGIGVDEVMEQAVRLHRREAEGGRADRAAAYTLHVEEAIAQVAAALAPHAETLPSGLPARGGAILALEGDAEVTARLRGEEWGRRALRAAARAGAALARDHGVPVAQALARERHGLAGSLAAVAIYRNGQPASRWQERAWRLAADPATGFPLLLVALGGLFGALFFGGDRLSALLDAAWRAAPSRAIGGLLHAVAGTGALARTLAWGFDAGLNAVLSVGIPYVFVFYLLLALVEDSGYLNCMAFLTDVFMHKLGLHGRAAIPLVAAGGCTVPAVLGTRALGTRRERLIASALACLVPCSARTAVIAGAVALFVGWGAALGIYALTAALVLLAGWALNRILPGASPGLVMELFPLRWPAARTVLQQTWLRFREFLFVAGPVVLAGSLVLGALYETGAVWALAAPLRPVVEGWLGLPAVAGLTLVFAVLRKELALQLLVALAAMQYGAGA
ncbi:MAG TPA: ferrous iron transport protein B, partial [Candidatus Sulfotelmatobacter sp.]|nr:ferrous iron transport protein B [Candidatus Sulfotelmatobacter sp.]